MKTGCLSAGVIVALIVCGCTEGSDSGDDNLVVLDGKEDGFGFQFGIYMNDDYYSEDGPVVLMVAFHDVSDGVPEGYAGHFDYSEFDYDEDITTYHTGIFQLYAQGERTGVILESYDGQTIGQFDWSYEGRDFRMGDFTFYRLNQSTREEVLRQCEAFQVIDYFFEEGFTPYEYPSVYVETDGQGGYEVQFGSGGFETADGDTIEVGTNDAGEFEATVTSSYGDTYLLQISNESPSRGRVLYGDDGEEPHLAANLVCVPPPAAPPGPALTNFTCTTRQSEDDGQTATIRFTVINLNDPGNMDLYWPEEVEEPITVVPETSYANTLVGGIADGYLTYRDGMLRIFTDQIGYEFGELELYENSGYENGYFRFEMMDPDQTTFYTEVDCVLE